MPVDPPLLSPHSCVALLSPQAIDVPVFEMGTSVSPVEIARKGVEEARRLGVDAVIVDTAGRLQVWGEDVMMAVRPLLETRSGRFGEGLALPPSILPLLCLPPSPPPCSAD